MESYASDVDDYKACLLKEAQAKIRQSVDEYNEAVSNFNRRARGG